MSKDIIVADSSHMKNELSLNSEDVTRLVSHLKIVRQVVSEVMVEGLDGKGDYGVVPGTKQKALYKAGSEKLMKLFGLGVRFRETGKEFDRYENFAMFTYEAEVYHLKSGTVIATCEGTANSQEKKYKEKAIYTNRVKTGVEIVPVCDILNTLRKMAQKRAMVGAVIIATGASDYFTQDEDEIASQAPTKKEATVSDASRFEKPASNLGSYIAPVGKHKDKTLDQIGAKELANYVAWVTANNQTIDGKMKEFIDTSRDYLKTVSA